MQGDAKRRLNPRYIVLKFCRRCPLVTITVVMGLVGIIFWRAGADEVTRCVFSVLAIVAVVSTVLVGVELSYPGRAACRQLRNPLRCRLVVDRFRSGILCGDPVRFAEVLVLATPYLLVLATPVAFLGGMSRAVHRRIIVKDGEVRETSARSRTAVFEKTGSITVGTPTITRMLIREPCEEAGLSTQGYPPSDSSPTCSQPSSIRLRTIEGLRCSPRRKRHELSVVPGTTALIPIPAKEFTNE